MKRLEFLKSYVEHKADHSRIEYLGGNFYFVEEAQAAVLCTMGVARDPEAPAPEPDETEAFLTPGEAIGDPTGFAV
jgi:hypothetical protein